MVVVVSRRHRKERPMAGCSMAGVAVASRRHSNIKNGKVQHGSSSRCKHEAHQVKHDGGSGWKQETQQEEEWKGAAWQR